MTHAWQLYNVAVEDSAKSKGIALYDPISELIIANLVHSSYDPESEGNDDSNYMHWAVGVSRPKPNIKLPSKDMLIVAMAQSLGPDVPISLDDEVDPVNPKRQAQSLRISPSLSFQQEANSSSRAHDQVVYGRPFDIDGQPSSVANRVATIIVISKRADDEVPWGQAGRTSTPRLSDCAKLLLNACYVMAVNHSREAVIVFWSRRKVHLLGFYRTQENAQAWISIRVVGGQHHSIDSDDARDAVNASILQLIRTQNGLDPKPLASLGLDSQEAVSILMYAGGL